MQAILVARDNDEREIVSFILRHAGLAVATTSELRRVAANWLERPADIVVVSTSDPPELVEDVNALRAVTQVPLLLVTETAPEKLLCALLQAGADLVLFRPVSPRVLTHYTRALLRRAGAVPAFTLPQLDLEEINLNPSTRAVTVAGQDPQRLTQLEFRLLYGFSLEAPLP
jgi:DNA-binding response OmpR family regulator